MHPIHTAAKTQKLAFFTLFASHYRKQCINTHFYNLNLTQLTLILYIFQMTALFWVLHTMQWLNIPVFRRNILHLQDDWIRVKWIEKQDTWQHAPPKCHKIWPLQSAENQNKTLISSTTAIKTWKLHAFIAQRLLMPFIIYFLICNVLLPYGLIWNKILNRSTFHKQTPLDGLTILFSLILDKVVKQMPIKNRLFGPTAHSVYLCKDFK